MALVLKVRGLLLLGLLAAVLTGFAQAADQEESVGSSYYDKELADTPADSEKSDHGATHTESVLSTYYGEELAGSPTASGEPFNPYGFTAAHPYLPFGTKLLVSYNGRSVIVMVNDRGPYGSDYELDLSSGAAQAIGLADAGGGVVDMEVLDP
jgi:rare lipoprotein A